MREVIVRWKIVLSFNIECLDWRKPILNVQPFHAYIFEGGQWQYWLLICHLLVVRPNPAICLRLLNDTKVRLLWKDSWLYCETTKVAMSSFIVGWDMQLNCDIFNLTISVTRLLRDKNNTDTTFEVEWERARVVYFDALIDYRQVT